MHANKILQGVIYGGLLLLPFIAFLVPQSLFFPFIAGKNFAFRILVEIIFALWLVLCLRDRRYWPQRSWIMYAAGAFLGVLVLADLFGANPSRSFWSNYERMEGLITHLHLFAYFLVLGSTIGTGVAREKSEQLWIWLLHTHVGASVIMTIIGLRQVFDGSLISTQSGARVDGTFGNAAYMAIYFVFHIFIIAFLAARHGIPRWARYAYGALALVQMFLLYRTATRGAIIGLVLGALVALGAYLWQDRTYAHGRKIALGAAGLLLVVVAGFLSIQKTESVLTHPVLSRFTTEGLMTAVRTRSTLWQMAFRGWQERPLLGWGQENFNLIFNQEYDPRMHDQEQWFDRAHNVFFDWLTAAGILGLLAYLALYGAGVATAWRARREEITLAGRAVFIGLFVAYFVHNFTVFDNVVSYSLFFTILAYLHANTVDREHLAHHHATFDPYRQVASGLAVVAMVFLFYSWNVPAFKTNKALLQGFHPQVATEAQLVSFKTALAYDSFGTGEARERLVEQALRVASNAKVAEETKKEFLVLAEGEMRAQVDDNPNDARYRVYLGNFYASLGRHDSALEQFLAARALSPRKQTILFQVANLHIRKGENQEALVYLREAYELKPSYQEAAALYAAGLVLTGDDKNADAVLMEQFGTTVVPNDALVNAYAATKQYDRLLALWEERVRREPDNYQPRTALAAVYLVLGERNKAVTSLEEAIRLNPAFKEQGEFYIKEIRAGRNP